MSLTTLPAEDQRLAEDAAFLREITDDVRIPVYHEDDGKLLILAGKVNLLNFTDETGTRVFASLFDDLEAVFRSHVRGLAAQVDRLQPQRVVITKRQDPRFDDFKNFLRQSYEEEFNRNTLIIYRRKPEPPPGAQP